MSEITLFSWGYWGWGNATEKLVQAVDAAERERGFARPLFVDVRISRSVRAAGFRDHAFNELVGETRYRWMRALGNKRIETHAGPRIQIADPEAAGELLDLAAFAAKDERRVIFFCACERPINEDGEPCHRVTVARLVREVAIARNIPINTVEWPGGEPATLTLDVPSQLLRAVRRGRTSLPLIEPIALAELAALPWGSTAKLQSGDDKLALVTGPARYQSGAWQLPVLHTFDDLKASSSAAKEWGERFRREHGYEPETALMGPGG